MTVENIEITSVSLDFRQAVSDAIKYLYDLGHRTVGFIGGIEQLEDGTIFPDKRLNTFTTWGEEGWELVQVIPGPDSSNLVAYLKRPKA